MRYYTGEDPKELCVGGSTRNHQIDVNHASRRLPPQNDRGLLYLLENLSFPSFLQITATRQTVESIKKTLKSNSMIRSVQKRRPMIVSMGKNKGATGSN